MVLISYAFGGEFMYRVGIGWLGMERAFVVGVVFLNGSWSLR